MATINGTFLPDFFLFGDIDPSDESDEINGFGGNDTIFPGEDNDIVDGGIGTDTVNYSTSLSGTGTQGVTVDLVGGGAIDAFGDADQLISIENVVGTNMRDTIQGDGGNNVLTLLGGNDVVAAGGGDDTIFGGGGNDVIGGDGGNDTIFGDGGDDIIGGGDGNDTIFGGFGNDTIDGQANNDTIFGGAGDDVIGGGGGNDTLNGGTGNDELVFFFDDDGSTAGEVDTVQDFQDDGGFLGFLATLTGEDTLNIQVENLDAGEMVVAERSGNQLIIHSDDDGNLGNGGNTVVGTIEFASAFIVNNIDAADLEAASNVDVFV